MHKLTHRLISQNQIKNVCNIRIRSVYSLFHRSFGYFSVGRKTFLSGATNPCNE